MRKFVVVPIILVLLASGVLVGCGTGARGTLHFVANGEDFVRQGFVSKDGWSITFDHVYVNLADVAAHQSDPPYDPHEGGNVQAETTVALDGTHTVDLAERGDNAPPIAVGEVTDAPAGHYNAISWEMTEASKGPAKGYALLIVGTAEKDGETVDFTVGVDQAYEYTCGEYVGDERKGMVEKDSSADVEMTFHCDHIFGDAETPMDDDLNVGAPGFEPFAQAAEGGTLEASLSDLELAFSAEAYQILVDALPTLGHVGEGHCHCEVQ